MVAFTSCDRSAFWEVGIFLGGGRRELKYLWVLDIPVLYANGIDRVGLERGVTHSLAH